MERVTPPSSILPEVLKKDNYERWSIFMRNYLELQDLWEVVQSPKMPQGGNGRELKKKNALALYAIRISCGTEAFDRIKTKRSAKDAWDELEFMLKPPDLEEVTTGFLFELNGESQTGHQETLHNYVIDGDISSAKQFLHENPDARSPEMLDSALHIAITYGHKKMARYLYCEIPQDFLAGDRGFFLLKECITKKMFDIALELLQNFSEAFRCSSSFTPIILTLAQTPPPFLKLNELGFWGRWLYSCTRVKAFSIKPRSNRACLGIIQDQLWKWILPGQYKFHLVSVMIGLLGLLPATMGIIFFTFVVCTLLVVVLFKLDVAGILIMGLLLAATGPSESIVLGGAFGAGVILFLVILRVRRLNCGPIGMPLLALVTVAWLLKYALLDPGALLILVLPLFSLFSLISMPLLIFVIQIYNLKLMDEYALEVIRLICGSLSNLDETQFVQSGAVEATFQAIKNGIPEIVIELITKANNANILWRSTDLEDTRNMFASAIAHRQEKVACFLHEFGASKNTNVVTTIDEDGNNTLHLAAKLAPYSQLDHISGAALQLQNELHWFKSVESIVPRFYNEQKNKDGETPTQLFLREHQNLLKEAEEWMKKVAESSTVVGALVITIMFAAVFTVPGGNNQDTGFPIFLKKTSDPSSMGSVTPPPPAAAIPPSAASFTVLPFMVFIVSDAISLFAASSSVLMFMGILTSRYACQDFHISLPMKLIIGLSSLFISIAAMMVAFCATLFMMLHDRLGIVITIIFLAGIPVTLFVSLQSPLLAEIYTSTFRPDIFYKRKYLKNRMKFCSSLSRRWWFRARKGRMVVILGALVLLYVTSNYWTIYFVNRY